jgi:hypothetical protein
MRKLLFSLTILLALFISAASIVSADSLVAEASSQLKVDQKASDYRVDRLESYLENQSSPLAPYAQDFIEIADKYGLDWRLVPAISGVESTFGKRIPYKSFNAYGWAGGDFRFASWKDSIEVVSKALKENYVDKGAPSLAKIGRRYCPPNPAWAGKVKFFMQKIEALPLSFDLEV